MKRFAVALLLLYQIACAQQQDTVLSLTLDTVNVRSTRIWHNDTAWYRYNQTKYYVTTIMPYVLEASSYLKKLEQIDRQPSLSPAARRQQLKQIEADLHQRFDSPVRNLNETQGVLLVKLIARQNQVNIYDLLCRYKNGFTALKWQAWARLHGFNLRKNYRPADEPVLEMVMTGLGYPFEPVPTRQTMLSGIIHPD